MAGTSDGGGYWLVGSDGGVFSFGDAAFYGSLGATKLAAPIVGLTLATAGATGSPGGGPLSIVNTTLPAGVVGQRYQAVLSASGGLPPYTWSIGSGTLPEGLSLDATTGEIAGTPGATAVAPLTLAVSDSRGVRVTTMLTLVVGGAAITPGQGQGALAITVDQLPPGLDGSVTVSGPNGYSSAVTATTTLSVAPGTYTVSAAPVGDSSDTYYPTVTGAPAIVDAGQVAVVGVSYLTTVPDTTRVLSSSDEADLTSVSPDGTTLFFSWSGPSEPPDLAGLQDGDVVDVPPGGLVPQGMLARITNLVVDGNTLVVTTVHAGLVEAVSQGEFEIAGQPVQLSKARVRQLVAQSDSGHVHALTSTNPSSFACQAGAQGTWGKVSLGTPTFTITPHLDASWSAGSGLQADAYLTIIESISYNISINAGITCQYTYAIVPKFPLDPAGIPITLGPIVINITPVLEVDATAQAQVTATLAAQGTQGFTLQVGASYAGGQLSPIDSYTPQNTFTPSPATASGYAKLSIGPKLTFNIGFVPWETGLPLIGPYVGLDGYAKAQFQQTQPTWAVAVGLEATVGFQVSVSFGIFSVGLNAQLTIPIVTVTLASSSPVLTEPPQPPGALPPIETGTLAAPYAYQLQAGGYTGSGAGFNTPAGPITFSQGGTNDPLGPVQISKTGLLTITGLPLSYTASTLDIPVDLTDALGNVSTPTLVVPVIPGVHPQSFPLPTAEDGLPYGPYKIPITQADQGGTAPYTCPNPPGLQDLTTEFGSVGLEYYSASTSTSTDCYVQGYPSPNFADPSVATGPTDQPMQVVDSFNPPTTAIDTLTLPPVVFQPSPVLPDTYASTALWAEEGRPFSFAPGVADGQGPYSWSSASCGSSSNLIPGVSIDPVTGAVSGTPSPGSGGSDYNLPVTVSDSLGGSGCGTQLVHVIPPLSIQVANSGGVVLNGSSLPTAEVGAAYQAYLLGANGLYQGFTGPYDWKILGFSPGSAPGGVFDELPPGLSLDPNTGSLSGIPLPGTDGTYSVTFEGEDTFGGETTATLTLTVLAPPTVTTRILPSATPGSTYSATPGSGGLSAAGGSGSYSWSVIQGQSGLNACNLTLDADGTIHTQGNGVVPSLALFGCSSILLGVQVTDALGATVNWYVWLPVGVAVTTFSVPPAEGGVAYQTTLQAEGGTAPYSWTPLACNACGLPAGLYFHRDGTISGTTTQIGTYNFREVVTDANRGTWTSPFLRLVVAPALRVAPSLPQADLATAYTAVAQTDGGVTPIASWVLTSGSLPAGLSLASDGTVSGTPTQVGTFRYKVTVTDSAGVIVNQAETLDVVAGPSVTTTSLPPAAYNVAYSATVVATGGTIRTSVVNDLGTCAVTGTSSSCTAAGSSPASPYLWSLAPGDQLPAGLSFDAATGTISGTPSLSAVGSSTGLHVTAADSWGAQGAAALTLSVAEPLAATTQSLPMAEQGAGYTALLQAVGGTPPYSWRVTNGTLPEGLSLDPATGTLSGTPSQAGGDFSQLEFCVTDTAGSLACNDHSLGLGVSSPVVLTTTILPGATAGSAYSATLQAGGGRPGAGGYVWSLPASSTASGYPLPPWLSLTPAGTLSGSPPAAASSATFQVPVQVSDSLGGVASGSLSLVLAGTVSLPDLTITSASVPTSWTSGSPTSVSWTVRNIGAAAALGPWSDSVYLSSTANGTKTDLGDFNEPGVSQVPAGSSYSDTESVTIPAGTSPGSYDLTVVADSELTIAESSYSNNSSVTPITVSAPGGGGSGSVTEFPVISASSQPDGITAGPDGNMWFTEKEGNSIGRITPTGRVTEYPLPTPSAAPYDIAAGSDGNLWFTEAAANKIGRITPSGTVTEYPLAASSEPGGITAGTDGNLWFTEYGAGAIGRITPSGTVTVYPLPTVGASPYDITEGPDGNLWFTEIDSGKIGKISTSGSVTEYSGLTTGSQPTGITAGPDGKLWFTETAGNKVGSITTSGTVAEYVLTTTNASPNNITAGPDGNLWFSEQSGDKIGRITPSGVVTEYAVPSSASQPGDIAAGPDGNLWFSELVGNKIGRIAPGGQPTLVGVATSPGATSAIAVGYAGTVLTTTDGSTWTPGTSATTEALNGVAFNGPGSQDAWAVGAGGTILHTTNSGSTWVAQVSNTADALNAVSCPATTTCFAVGANGVILATTDGSTWSAQTSPTAGALNGISCSSASKCLAVGAGGTILATSNAGSSWSAEGTGVTDNTLNSVTCADSSSCWAVGDNGVIVDYNQSGSPNWSLDPSSGTATYQDLYGVAAGGYCGVSTVGFCVMASGARGSLLGLGTSSWSGVTSATTDDLRGFAFVVTASFTKYIAVGEDETTLAGTPLGA